MNSKWSTQFITGIKEIDEHHFIIIKKLYELEQLRALNPSRSEIMDALLFLETYTRMHFQKEEQIMAEMHCPAAQENKQQHEEFITRVHELNELFARGNVSESSLDNIEQDLTIWVTNHILNVDMKLKIEEPIG